MEIPEVANKLLVTTTLKGSMLKELPSELVTQIVEMPQLLQEVEMEEHVVKYWRTTSHS